MNPTGLHALEIDGQSRSCEVLLISRPDGRGDIAGLGLTLAEAKQLQCKSGRRSMRRRLASTSVSAGLSVTQREVPPQGLADAPDSEAIWRGQGEASRLVCAGDGCGRLFSGHRGETAAMSE
jgi:hypothetical protein